MGDFRTLDDAQNIYRSKNGGSYIRDYAESHLKLGLGVRLGSVVILVPLDAHKDHEFVIISPNLNQDWVRAFHAVIR